MKKIDINLLGHFASITALILSLIPDFLSQYSLLRMIIFVGVIISLIYIIFISIKHNREIQITNDFIRYAEHCSEIIKSAKGHIFTVQTPYKCSKASLDEASFKKYAKDTAKKLFKLNKKGNREINDYRRLIIIEKENLMDQKEKVNDLLDSLFIEANSSDTKPDFNNFKICLINKNKIPKYFYSNLEILTTDSSDHAIAFQCSSDVDGRHQFEWSSSIFIKPKISDIANYSIVKTLEDSFKTLWTKCTHNSEFGIVYDFENEYNEKLKHQQLKEEQVRITSLILRKMDEIASQ